MYRQKKPATLIRIIGQTPLNATEAAANPAQTVLDELIRFAAQAGVMHNDILQHALELQRRRSAVAA